MRRLRWTTIFIVVLALPGLSGGCVTMFVAKMAKSAYYQAKAKSHHQQQAPVAQQPAGSPAESTAPGPAGPPGQ